MLKYFFNLILILFFVICDLGLLFSQDDSSSKLPYLIPYRIGDKWGFCDKEKNIIVPVKYDEVEFFDTLINKIKINNKWGCIDKYGNELIPIKYESIFFMRKYYLSQYEDYLELLCYKLNGKYGIIDLNGKEVTPPIYDEIGAYGHFCWKDYAKVSSNNKFGFINLQGKEIIPPIYDEYDYSGSGFSEGLCGVHLKGKKIYIDSLGRKIFSSIYDEIGKFVDGLATVKLKEKWGFINKEGKVVIPLKYDFAWDFRDGYAKVKLISDSPYGKYGLIDKSGNEIVPVKYDYIENFYDSIARFGVNNYINNSIITKLGLINKKGIEIVYAKYNNIFRFDDYMNLLFVKLDNKWGVINKKGEILISCKYDNLIVSNTDLIVAALNGKLGFIDKSGNEVIPLKYDFKSSMFDLGKIEYCNNNSINYSRFCSKKNNNKGLCPVEINFKKGFINKKDSVVVPLKYDCVTDFVFGFSKVTLNSKIGIVNSIGEEIIQPKYDDFYILTAELIIGGSDNKFIIFDKFGNKMNTVEYDEYKSCDDYVCVKVNNRWGAIDNNCKEIIPIIYDEIEYLSFVNLFRIKLKGKYGYVSTDGTEYWEDLTGTFQKCFEFENFSEEYYGIVYITKMEYSQGQGWISIYKKNTKEEIIKVESDKIYLNFHNGKLIANIKDYLYYGEESLIFYKDLNFDGINDFAILDGAKSCYGGPSYKIYLSESNNFVYNDKFTELAQNYCGMFNIDYDKKIISTMTKSGWGQHLYSDFKIKNNVPIKYQEIFEDATKDDRYVIITTKKLIDGRWIEKITREKKIK